MALPVWPFIYGLVGGAISCLFFFLAAFQKIESATTKMVRKRALKHEEFSAVAKEAAIVPRAKVETLCKLVRFDDSIVGEAIQCRAVFMHNTITIYQVDKLDTLPDHRQVVAAEHPLGRINSSCVIASSTRISKYHRHTDMSSRFAPVKGKCTMLKAKDGLPLFLVDPAVVLEQHINAAKRERRRAGHRSRRDEDASKTAGKEAERGDGVNGGGTKPLPLAEWRCIAIKFPTRRENERWFNLLQATGQTMQWRDFLNHLPNVDVLNLLLARLFFENTRTSGLHDILQKKIQDTLSTVSKALPERMKGSILLDGLTVGGEIPLFSNVSDAVTSPSGELDFDFDVLYRGGLVLNIRFAITYRDLRVPDIIFNIKVLEVAGRVRFNLGPPPTRKYWLGFFGAPQLRLSLTQEVASHSGVLNAVMNLLPDLSQFATNIVKEKLFEDMILPRLDEFPWIVLGDDSDEEEDADADAKSEASVGVDGEANKKRKKQTLSTPDAAANVGSPNASTTSKRHSTGSVTSKEGDRRSTASGGSPFPTRRLRSSSSKHAVDAKSDADSTAACSSPPSVMKKGAKSATAEDGASGERPRDDAASCLSGSLPGSSPIITAGRVQPPTFSNPPREDLGGTVAYASTTRSERRGTAVPDTLASDTAAAAAGRGGGGGRGEGESSLPRQNDDSHSQRQNRGDGQFSKNANAASPAKDTTDVRSRVGNDGGVNSTNAASSMSQFGSPKHSAQASTLAPTAPTAPTRVPSMASDEVGKKETKATSKAVGNNSTAQKAGGKQTPTAPNPREGREVPGTSKQRSPPLAVQFLQQPSSLPTTPRAGAPKRATAAGVTTKPFSPNASVNSVVTPEQMQATAAREFGEPELVFYSSGGVSMHANSQRNNGSSFSSRGRLSITRRSSTAVSSATPQSSARPNSKSGSGGNIASVDTTPRAPNSKGKPNTAARRDSRPQSGKEVKAAGGTAPQSLSSSSSMVKPLASTKKTTTVGNGSAAGSPRPPPTPSTARAATQRKTSNTNGSAGTAVASASARTTTTTTNDPSETNGKRRESAATPLKATTTTGNGDLSASPPPRPPPPSTSVATA